MSQMTPPGAAAAADTATVTITSTPATAIVPGSQKYWARRLWVFLCKVRELKSVPKNEKALEQALRLKNTPVR
jgi:hypothetical protein